eukprot:Platyproteum_vivax@DN9300_c0_g1_i1.p1
MMLYQHALAHVFARTANRQTPVQMVYPTGDVSFGFPPCSVKRRLSRDPRRGSGGNASGNDAAAASSEEQGASELQAGTVLVYASPSYTAEVQRTILGLTAALLACAIVQTIGVVTVFLGGMIYPLGFDCTESMAGYNPRMILYMLLFVAHLFLVVGLLYRIHSLLVVYKMTQLLCCIVGVTICVCSLVDVGTLAMTVPVVYLTNRLLYYLVSCDRMLFDAPLSLHGTQRQHTALPACTALHGG